MKYMLGGISDEFYTYLSVANNCSEITKQKVNINRWPEEEAPPDIHGKLVRGKFVFSRSFERDRKGRQEARGSPAEGIFNAARIPRFFWRRR